MTKGRTTGLTTDNEKLVINTYNMVLRGTKCL